MNQQLPTLSICIPTRNRPKLLADLLDSLCQEITLANLTPDEVGVLVSDNASEPATRETAHRIMGGLPHFTYSRNERNLGAVGNVIKCIQSVRGRWVWLIGDDEVVAGGTLRYLLHELWSKNPGWFIHSDGAFGKSLGPPRMWRTVEDFVAEAAARDPYLLMTAGTISLNTFRSDCFDHDPFEVDFSDIFSHWYGLMSGLKFKSEHHAPVVLTDRATVIVREVRPKPPDGLERNSDRAWRECMEWLRNRYGLPGLDVNIMSKVVSDQWRRDMLRNPLRTLLANWRLFCIPGTYVRAARRLRHMVR